MSIVVTLLATLFLVVAIFRLPTAVRRRDARTSYLTVVFASPALLLLNTEFVHALIRQFPAAAGPIRIAPFLLAMLALWCLAESANQVIAGKTHSQKAILEPIAWCLLVVVVFQFVRLDPLAEVFTIVHARQPAGLAYTLIYYSAEAVFAAKLVYRVMRTKKHGPGYLLLGTGGVLVAAACLWQYALLIPVHLDSPPPEPFFGVFDVLFFSGVLSIVLGLQTFVLAHIRRRSWVRRQGDYLERLLTARGLETANIPDRARQSDGAYAVFAQLVRIDDYAVQGRLQLTDHERSRVEDARRWVSRTLPTLTNVRDYSSAIDR